MFPASCFLPQTSDYWTILLTKLVNKNKLNKIDTTYMVENIIHIWVCYLIVDVQNHLLLIQWIFKCILVAVAMMECVESWSMSSSFVEVPDMRWDLLPHIDYSMFCFQWVEEEVSVLAVGRFIIIQENGQGDTWNHRCWISWVCKTELTMPTEFEIQSLYHLPLGIFRSYEWL
jgi:hypothetical protein